MSHEIPLMSAQKHFTITVVAPKDHDHEAAIENNTASNLERLLYFGYGRTNFRVKGES